MRFSGAHYEYGVIKLEYVDYDNNSDKFYTIIIDRQNQTWWAHYGRNGTTGSYTAPKSVGRLASNGAVKKANEKLDKGYDLIMQGIASFATQPTTRQVLSAPLNRSSIL